MANRWVLVGLFAVGIVSGVFAYFVTVGAFPLGGAWYWVGSIGLWSLAAFLVGFSTMGVIRWVKYTQKEKVLHERDGVRIVMSASGGSNKESYYGISSGAFIIAFILFVWHLVVRIDLLYIIGIGFLCVGWIFWMVGYSSSDIQSK